MRKLIAICVFAVLLFAHMVSATEPYRTWRDLHGRTISARIINEPTSKMTLEYADKRQYPQKFTTVGYDIFSNEDLGYVGSKFENTRQHIGPIVLTRISDMIQTVNLEGLSEIKRTMPFMEPYLATALRDKLASGSQQYNLQILTGVVMQFPDTREIVEGTMKQRLDNPTTKFRYVDLNAIATAFPDLRPAVIDKLRTILNDPSQNFFAKGTRNPLLDGLGGTDRAPYAHEGTGAVVGITASNAGRMDTDYRKLQASENRLAVGDQQMQMQLDAFEQICRNFPELVEDVTKVLNREIQNPVNYERFQDLLSLNRITLSFPGTEESVKAILVRSIKNPLLLDGKEIDVATSVVDHYSQKDVIGGGGYRQRDYYKREVRTDVTVVDFFDHKKLEQIARRFPTLTDAVREAIATELKKPVNRWAFDELRRIRTSFPKLDPTVLDVLTRELRNTANTWTICGLMEVATSFPDALKDVEATLARVITVPRETPYSFEALVSLAQQFPDLQDQVRGIVVTQLENPLFANAFSDAARVNALLTAFPECSTQAKPMVSVLLRQKHGYNSQKSFSVAKIETTLTMHPALADTVEGIVEDELAKPALSWDQSELDALVALFPSLKSKIASVVERELNEPGKKFSLEDLETIATTHPEARESVVERAKRMLQDVRTAPTSLADAVDYAMAFEELSHHVGRCATPFLEIEASTTSIREMEFLVTEYPILADQIRDVEIRNFTEIAERSSPEDLEQWMHDTGNEDPSDETVRAALEDAGIELPVPPFNAGEWVRTKGGEIYAEHKGYIFGYVAILGILLFLGIFLKPRWLWWNLIGIALVIPAPFILIMMVRRAWLWTKQTTAASVDAAKRKADQVKGAVSSGVEATKQKARQASSVVSDAAQTGKAKARKAAQSAKAQLVKKSQEFRDALDAKEAEAPDDVTDNSEELASGGVGLKVVQPDDQPDADNPSKSDLPKTGT